LEQPAKTVEEGSATTVTALGHKLVATYRQR